MTDKLDAEQVLISEDEFRKITSKIKEDADRERRICSIAKDIYERMASMKIMNDPELRASLKYAVKASMILDEFVSERSRDFEESKKEDIAKIEAYQKHAAASAPSLGDVLSGLFDHKSATPDRSSGSGSLN